MTPTTKVTGTVAGLAGAAVGGEARGWDANHWEYHCSDGAPGSETSKDAAKSISKFADQQRTDVYLCIHRAHDNGRTWSEIVELLGCSPTANGRVTELRDRGLIVDSGRRRRTPTGRKAVVWIVPPLEAK